mgnify:CR=1 FL=1
MPSKLSWSDSFYALFYPKPIRDLIYSDKLTIDWLSTLIIVRNDLPLTGLQLLLSYPLFLPTWICLLNQNKLTQDDIAFLVSTRLPLYHAIVGNDGDEDEATSSATQLLLQGHITFAQLLTLFDAFNAFSQLAITSGYDTQGLDCSAVINGCASLIAAHCFTLDSLLHYVNETTTLLSNLTQHGTLPSASITDIHAQLSKTIQHSDNTPNGVLAPSLNSFRFLGTKTSKNPKEKASIYHATKAISAIKKWAYPHNVDLALLINTGCIAPNTDESFILDIPYFSKETYDLIAGLVTDNRITWPKALKHPNAFAFIASCLSASARFGSMHHPDIAALSTPFTPDTLECINDENAALLTYFLSSTPETLHFVLDCGITPMQLLSIRVHSFETTPDNWMDTILPTVAVLIEANKMTFDQCLAIADSNPSAWLLCFTAYLVHYGMLTAAPDLASLQRLRLALKHGTAHADETPHSLIFDALLRSAITFDHFQRIWTSCGQKTKRFLQNPTLRQLLKHNILNSNHLAQAHFSETHDALLHLTSAQIESLFVIQRLRYEDVRHQTHNQLLAMSLGCDCEMPSIVITLPLPKTPDELDHLTALLDAYLFTRLEIKPATNLEDDFFNYCLTSRELDWITQRITAQRKLESLDFLPSRNQLRLPSLLIKQSAIPDAVKRFVTCLSNAPYLSTLSPPDMVFLNTLDEVNPDNLRTWEGEDLVMDDFGWPRLFLPSHGENLDDIPAREAQELAALQAIMAPNILVYSLANNRLASFWATPLRRNHVIWQLIEHCFNQSQLFFRDLITEGIHKRKVRHVTREFLYKESIAALDKQNDDIPPGAGKNQLETLIAWFTYLRTRKAKDLNGASHGFQILICEQPLWGKICSDYNKVIEAFLAKGMAHARLSRQSISADNALNAQELLTMAYFSCLPADSLHHHFQMRWSATVIEKTEDSCGKDALHVWKEVSNIGMMEAMGTTESFDAVVLAIRCTHPSWVNGIPESPEAFTADIEPNSTTYAQHCIAYHALSLLKDIAHLDIKQDLVVKIMFASLCEEPWFDDWLAHYQAFDNAPAVYRSGARRPRHFQPAPINASDGIPEHLRYVHDSAPEAPNAYNVKN